MRIDSQTTQTYANILFNTLTWTFRLLQDIYVFAMDRQRSAAAVVHSSHRLTLANTLHPQKERSRVATRRFPDHSTHNQIDVIFCLDASNRASTRQRRGRIGAWILIVTTAWSWQTLKHPTLTFCLLFDLCRCEIHKLRISSMEIFAALKLIDSDGETLSGHVTEMLLSTAKRS